MVKAALDEKTKEVDAMVREAQAARAAIARQKHENEKEEAKYSELQKEMVDIVREGQRNHERLQEQVAWYRKVNYHLTRPVEEVREDLKRCSIELVGTVQPQHGMVVITQDYDD